jgi:hypothetical protein
MNVDIEKKGTDVLAFLFEGLHFKTSLLLFGHQSVTLIID